MSNVEIKLQSAADETRRLADSRRARPLTQPRQHPRPRGWLVFSAAFAVVIVTFGLVPWLVGGGETQPSDDVAPPSTAPASTETTAPTDVSCSAAGVPVPGTVSDLPEPVAATRQALIEAASTCELEALESLAAEGFSTSFGGGGFENLRQWEDEGTGQLGTLLRLLGMSYQTDDSGNYVWPGALGYTHWDDIPADLIDEVRQIHTQEELDMFSEFGSYAGWRTGIDQDGNWLFFTAGD